ncbi:MAG: HindVP family restriction endonuclease [Phycisphaerales bacterium JB050]
MSTAPRENPQQPSLFGIDSSNRTPDQLWGKNRFNNAFPVSLACWLRHKGLSFTELAVDGGKLSRRERSIDILLGLSPNEKPHFWFETPFAGHEDLCLAGIERVDVVVAPVRNRSEHRRALEIKLIVVPDKATAGKPEELWAPEIVFRPSTSTNAAAALYLKLKKLNLLKKARDILDPVCSKVHGWGNPVEMSTYAPDIICAFQKLICMTESDQSPLVMCTIWRTEGQSPVLSDSAFDIICWTDCMLLSMICERSGSGKIGSVSRTTRSALRAVRIVYELILSGRFNLNVIISEMSFNHQDDKDLAINGNQTIRYMKCDRLRSPIIKQDVLKQLILGGGIEHLSPERRLDATLYFAYKYARSNET